MSTVAQLVTKPVGEVLQEAGLINTGQFQVALMEQSIYTNLRLGEILALHGWVKQETADFFAEKMRRIIDSDIKMRIGGYFFQAGLLSEQDIDDILREQRTLGVKFGSVAVLRGCIKQETLDFFIRYFVPTTSNKTNFTDKDTLASNQEIQSELKSPIKIANSAEIASLTGNIDIHRTVVDESTLIQQDRGTVSGYGDSIQIDADEIPWVD